MPTDLDQRAITSLTDPRNEEWISNLPPEVIAPMQSWFTLCDLIERIGLEAGVPAEEASMDFARNWARRIRRSVTSIGGFRSKQMVEVATREQGQVLPGAYRAPGTVGQAPGVTVINQNGPQAPKPPTTGNKVLNAIKKGL